MNGLTPMDINRYINMAEENFSGANGNPQDDVWNISGFEDQLSNMGGNPAFHYNMDAGNEFLPADAGVSSATQNMVVAKTPTPYQVVVTNTTASPLTVVLFGLNQYLLSPNFGSATGVTVIPAQTNISYLELLQQSANQPFETSLIRIQSANPIQVTQILNVQSKDANGQECTVPIITQSYFSANQFQSGIVDVPYPVKIDGNTNISFTILGSTSAVYTFFPSTKINSARALGARSAVQQYSAPIVPIVSPVFTARPTGFGVPAQVPAYQR